MRKTILLAIIVLTLGLMGTAQQKQLPMKYAVVYTVKVIDPTVVTAVFCSGSNWNCGVVYRDEQKTTMFDSLDAALRFLNNKDECYGTFSTTSPSWSTCMSPITAESFIGLYELKPISVGQVKVGEEKRFVQETVEKTIDKLEWKVQQ